MRRGKVVEAGPTEAIFGPRKPLYARSHGGAAGPADEARDGGDLTSLSRSVRLQRFAFALAGRAFHAGLVSWPTTSTI